MSCREMNSGKLCPNNNVIRVGVLLHPGQHILGGLQIPLCCVKKPPKNRHYYQLLKQTFTRKSARDAPANTFSGKYHLHGQQHSVQRGAKTRTESNANSKDDVEKKQNKKDAEFRTKSDWN